MGCKKIEQKGQAAHCQWVELDVQLPLNGCNGWSLMSSFPSLDVMGGA